MAQHSADHAIISRSGPCPIHCRLHTATEIPLHALNHRHGPTGQMGPDARAKLRTGSGDLYPAAMYTDVYPCVPSPRNRPRCHSAATLPQQGYPPPPINGTIHWWGEYHSRRHPGRAIGRLRSLVRPSRGQRRRGPRLATAITRSTPAPLASGQLEIRSPESHRKAIPGAVSSIVRCYGWSSAGGSSRPRKSPAQEPAGVGDSTPFRSRAPT